MPRNTSQLHFHNTAKVTPTKVWGSLTFGFVSSQENCLYMVNSIPKTMYGLFDLLTSPLQARNIPLFYPLCAFGSSGLMMQVEEHTV